MVATAIYSVTTVLWKEWKETAYPLWRAMERRWKNVVSPVSSVIVAIGLPIIMRYHYPFSVRLSVPVGLGAG